MQIVGGLGGILFLFGWVWLIIVAFKKDGVLWGLLNAFFLLFGGIIYALIKKNGWLQVGMMVIGIILSGASFGSTILDYFS